MNIILISNIIMNAIVLADSENFLRDVRSPQNFWKPPMDQLELVAFHLGRRGAQRHSP
jgi:hypothetical protein